MNELVHINAGNTICNLGKFVAREIIRQILLEQVLHQYPHTMIAMQVARPYNKGTYLTLYFKQNIWK